MAAPLMPAAPLKMAIGQRLVERAAAEFSRLAGEPCVAALDGYPAQPVA
jgi:hypothetical protein